MKILFIVGKMNDEYPIKYNSKKAPKWLKIGWREFEPFVDLEEKKVPCDVAMAIYLQYKYPQLKITCFNGFNKINLDFANKYDVIYVIYDYTEIFNCGDENKTKTCPNAVDNLKYVLKKTKAFVFPYPSFHEFILDKTQYYDILKKNKVPVVPFFKSTPNDFLQNLNKNLLDIKMRGWKGIIVKPTYAGYSIGIKVFKDIENTKKENIIKEIKKLKKYKYPSFTVAEFIESFGLNYEIRTYWLNEKYAYSVATLTKEIDDGDEGLTVDKETTFKSEGGILSDKLKSELIKRGKKIISILPKYDYGQPFLRIDFGCCIKTSTDCPENYFVNEIETLAANMLANDTKFPIVERCAEELYKFAKKVNGKKNNPKPKIRKTKKLKIKCIKSTRKI